MNVNLAIKMAAKLSLQCNIELAGKHILCAIFVLQIRISLPSASLDTWSRFNDISEFSYIFFIVQHIFYPCLKVSLPSCPLLLAPKDDAAEFDESEATTTKYEDNPKYVCLHGSNHVRESPLCARTRLNKS